MKQHEDLICPKCGQVMEYCYDEASETWGYVCKHCLLIIIPE